MKAVFDKNCNCVAWYNPSSGMVFDKNVQWVGFVEKNNFFAKNTNWLGGLYDGTFVDKSGKPVAWIEGYSPRGTFPLQIPLRPLMPLTPLTPLQPLMPLRPLRPLTPIGGWSRLLWSEYLRQL